ncbi:MAG: hypothetical protein WBV11_08485 [Salegentibacter sp.]
MKFLLKSASYVFHPLWMPFAGSLIYFLLSPRYFPTGVIKAKLLAIAILTLFIPVVFYFLLKNLGKAHNMFLYDVKERKWPLFFFILLLLMVLNQILNVYNYPALYYYFAGILVSTFVCYILSLFKFKISLHMVGLAGFTMFIISLSSFYHLNLIYSISFLVLSMGLTASSRLFYKAHDGWELILGLVVGLLPQVLVIKFWL